MKILLTSITMLVFCTTAFAYDAKCYVEYGPWGDRKKQTINISVNNGMLKTVTSHGGGYSRFTQKYKGSFIYQDKHGLITELGPIKNGKFSYDYDGYAYGTCYIK